MSHQIARTLTATERLLWAAHEGPDADPTDAARMTLTEGYTVQDALTQRRIQTGDDVVGFKIGLTTPTAQAIFAAAEPGSGRLFASAVQHSPAVVPVGSRPLLFEVEVAVVHDLDGTQTMFAAIEVVSTRWHGGAPGLAAWAADNAMATGAIVGSRGAPATSPLPAAPSAIATLGDQHWSATGPSVQTNVDWLTAHLAGRGVTLPDRAIVLTGSIIGPLPVPADGGRLIASVDEIGTVEVDFVPER